MSSIHKTTVLPSGETSADCPSSPPATQPTQRKNKLARRARSFKEDFLDKLANMRSPNSNHRSQSPNSPNSRPRSNGETDDVVKTNPLAELDDQVHQVQVALKHFRDVVSKNKLEMLSGNGTVVLDTVTNIVVLLRNCLMDAQSSTLLSATSQLHQCIARLIRLCDDVVLYGSPALGRENVAQLVQAVQEAVQNLVSLSREKLSQKNLSHHERLSDPGRSSLPDIPLTPREKQILQSTPKNIKTSHSSESILNSPIEVPVSSPPPKPPLPARASNEPEMSPNRISAPPLPPKRRHRTTTAPHSNNVSPNKAPSPTDLSTSIDRLSISPAHSVGAMAEDTSSLLSASNAGSLDSMLNPQNDDLEFESHRSNGNVSPMCYYNSRRESIESPSLLSPADLQSFGEPPPTSIVPAGHTSRTLLNFGEDLTDFKIQAASLRTSSSSYISQQSSSSVSYSSEGSSFTSFSTTRSSVEHTSTSTFSHETLMDNGASPPALPMKTRNKTPRFPSQYDNINSDVTRSQLVTSSSHHAELTCISPSDGSPPPLPLKKRHIMAYMEMFGNCTTSSSAFAAENFAVLRHSVHAYSAMQREWARTNAEVFMNTTHSCHFSGGMTQWPPLERVDPRSNLNATSPQESPPALPPKLGRSRSSISPPPLPPIYVALTPPILPPPSPVTPTPTARPRSPPVATSVREQPIYDFGRAPPVLPDTATIVATIQPNPTTPIAEVPGADIDVEEENTPLDLLDVTEYLVFKKPDEEGYDIKGGHPDALIVQATKANKNDFLYQEAFLTTYRTFLSPLELCRKLQRRYERFATHTTRQSAARNSFSLLVRVVSDLTNSDLSDELLRLLMDLIFHLLCCGDLNLARALRAKVLEKCDSRRNNLTSQNALLTSLSIHTRPCSLLDFKSEQLAEQMTLLDAELFMKIEIPEVLVWAQEQNEERSPNLTRFTEHFNKMSYWARSRILEQKDAKDRERYVVKFIKVMRHLRRANNFNSYLALLSALDSAPIRRLEWHRQITDGLKEYCALIDSSSSFRAYRLALAETQPPCIPYIGLVLQDLTFVHIGNSDLLPDSNINFSKRWQQFNIVENMKRFKKCQYSFKKQERILALFNNFDDFLCEESMWQISEQIKPRGTHKK